MLLKTRGTAINISEPIVAKVTRDSNYAHPESVLIDNDSLYPVYDSSYKALLTCLPLEKKPLSGPLVHSVHTLEHLTEGDIVVINPSGLIHTLYRVQSHQNFLLATERCNSNCLMCSQPPKDRDDTQYLFNIHRQLIPLIPKECKELGITGGEPTLLGESFFILLELIKAELPNTEVHCLTNGRTFCFRNIADRLHSIHYDRLMLGIPLYSDYYQLHDYIVQAKDAFNQTIKGLYNLALNDQRIEIRVVLHKLTIPRLVKLAKFIQKNLPFVEHVAFMGLEYEGYTPYNIEKLWIDPVDYMGELQGAVEYLSGFGMNVSIYNSQLCLMPETLWKFNKRSISDWKNIYLDECRKCRLSSNCGGLFASCGKKHSEFIKAF